MCFKVIFGKVMPKKNCFGTIFNNSPKILVILSKLGFRHGKMCHF